MKENSREKCLLTTQAPRSKIPNSVLERRSRRDDGRHEYDEGVDAVLEKELERYKDVLEARFGEALVALVAFGSQAQERARPESDLDLLIVIRDLPPRRLDRRRLLGPLAHEVSDHFANTVSAVLLTPTEASTIKPFYLGLLDGYRALVDREGFMQAIVARLERRLRELGARRLTDAHGDSYWDLKPDYVLGEDVVL